MKVLVLGAGSYIGSRVARALGATDWARPFVDCAPAPGREGAEITAIGCDLSSAAALAPALQGIDAVINGICSSPERIRQGADALFTAARGVYPPPRIIHLSSMSVYGSAQGDITEDSALRADLGPYSRAMADAEILAARHPLSVILRPGVEYGPGGELWSARIARWLIAKRMGDLGASGDGICNLVYIDDVVDAVLKCLQRPHTTGSAFNLAMPDPPTWNDYFIGYARALGAVPVRRISRRRLAIETKVLAAPLKVIEIATRRLGAVAFLPPPIPPSLLNLTRQEIRLNPTRAQHALDWHCEPLESGLAKSAAWFRSLAARGG